MKVKVIILRTAGTNCDNETQMAFELSGATTELIHINQIINNRKNLLDYHILALPGGFSYGDDISAGKVLANEFKYKIGEQIEKFIQQGKLIIGICNGFQVLVKSRLLPKSASFSPSVKQISSQKVTLFNNDSGRFECRWIYLKKVKNEKCVFTNGLDEEIIMLPVAHGEGKFITSDEIEKREIWKNGQVVFQYCDAQGNLAGYPYNPNGSEDNIAGICDETGRVFGLMPHPERHITYLQHPMWTREKTHKKHKESPGLTIFKNAVNYARKNS